MTAAALPPAGTEVTCLGGMPGVPKGTLAVVRHQSPDGTSNASRRLVWLELDDYIYWSHGRSQAKGYWAALGGFEVRR